jgi:hypothetical protein
MAGAGELAALRPGSNPFIPGKFTFAFAMTQNNSLIMSMF